MVKLLRVTAGALACLFVVAYQLQLLPFLQRLFVDERTFWPVLYYGCWTLVIVNTLLLLVLQRQLLTRTFPVLIVCALSAALATIHPLETVSKNFLLCMIFVASGTVLAIASAPLALLRFSAAATVLSAVLCLLDILFSHGFTNTVGRAAGLSINANVAAAALLLGASSSFWAVPSRLRMPFLLTVGAAILVTLSRSALLAALLISGVVVVDLTWARLKGAGPHRLPQRASAGITTLVLVAWISLALFTNDRFSVAATSSFQQIGSSVSALEEARQSAVKAVQAKLAGPTVMETANTTAAATPAAPEQADQAPAVKPLPSTSKPSPTLREQVAANFKTEEMIRAIERRAENEGDINSISARGLLMERAFLSYQTGPPEGRGLGAAHALQPHNTFMTFAIAFGHFGWFIPMAIAALTIWWARSIQELPLFLATCAVMMISHDLMFAPGLLSPIVLGIAGLNARRYGAGDDLQSLPAMPYVAVAAPLMFAIGAILLASVDANASSSLPRLLLLLSFCAVALWSFGIWRWYERSSRQFEAPLHGPGR